MCARALAVLLLASGFSAAGTSYGQAPGVPDLASAVDPAGIEPPGAEIAVPSALDGFADRVEIEELYAAPTRIDRIGRILAPVMVNGQGPFRFVVDTGANRSAISPRLAALLGLDEAAGLRLIVNGVTGRSTVPAVVVERIEAGDLLLEDSTVPVLWPPVMAEADGILGIEGLADNLIDVDFVEDRITIERSYGRGPDGRFIIIEGKLRNGGLFVVDARVGKVRTKAIIDTGAQRTLGNIALRNALYRALRNGDLPVDTMVLGATDLLQSGVSLRAPTVKLGDADLDNLVITFGDLHVFDIWGYGEKPAMLIGMDLLGTVERLIIDYRTATMYVAP